MYIKQFMPGIFDLLIADEVHQLKGGSTAQGNVLGMLSSACKKTIALTGTLAGGYADDVFYMLYRLRPQAISSEGIEWSGVQKWLAQYGVLETVVKRSNGSSSNDNRCSKGRSESKYVRRRPGISPMVFARHLMGSTVFLQLEDVADELPSYSEEALTVQMDEPLKEAYAELENKLITKLRSQLAQGSKRLLGTYLNALLAYPDRPFGWECLRDPANGDEIVTPRSLPQSMQFRKERELLDLVREEISQHRRVFVYCVFTGRRDVTARLKDILLKDGINVEILSTKVKPEAREAWVKSKTESGAQVIVANPKLVETGLDLLEFPTLVFFETGYSIYTLRQASRRSWRIGQDQPVKVCFMAYEDTLQEKALQLMGTKLEASLALEGKFSNEGLVAMTQSEDMTTALARALVEKVDFDATDKIWQRLRRPSQGSSSPKSTHAPPTRFVFENPLVQQCLFEMAAA